jgi:hypothetical protein
MQFIISLQYAIISRQCTTIRLGTIVPLQDLCIMRLRDTALLHRIITLMLQV